MFSLSSCVEKRPNCVRIGEKERRTRPYLRSPDHVTWLTPAFKLDSLAHHHHDHPFRLDDDCSSAVSLLQSSTTTGYYGHGLETRTSRALGIFFFFFPLFYQRVFTDKRFRLLNTTATSPIRLHDLPSRLNDDSSIVDDNTTAPFDSTTTAAASTAPFNSTTTAAASTAAVSNGCWTKDGRTDGWARRRQLFFFFSS